MGDHWLPLAIVLLIGTVFFGAKRLPEMGSAVGKTIREFQKSMREVSESPTPPAPVILPVDQVQLSAVSSAMPPALQQPATTTGDASARQ